MADRIDSIVDPVGQTYLLREAQRALVSSELAANQQAGLLGAILHNAPELIAFLDREGRVVFCNMSWLGIPKEELIGADWLSLQPPEQREPLQRLFNAVISTGQRSMWEGPGPRDSAGAIGIYFYHVGPVSDGAQIVGLVLICRDITAQKAAEKQLLAAERLASVGTLAAGVAHEINNPLSVVILNIELVEHALQGLNVPRLVSAELSEQLSHARVAAERVRRIVRDLRLFSRVEDDKRKLVDVEAVMELTIRLAEHEIRHRARLVRQYSGVPQVMADESRLGQVFLNLLVNAAQAIPAGNAEGNAIRITTTLGADQRVHICISDTGSGMPPEIRDRLFSPFFTTKPPGEGTGLGLSICQRLVSSLGGEISVQTEVGRGTEFCVKLPPAPPQKQENPPPASVAAIASGARPPVSAKRRGRVLFVDDEVAIGNIAKLIISRSHDAVAVSESPRALAMLQQGERFDLILCDVMIPQMTGIELYQATERIDPAQASRFVFMTGGASSAQVENFLRTCGRHWVEKPLTAHTLQALVDAHIDASSARQ
ncbi:MAG TPA: ATP-binding protein [Pseudomonadota bacterium]|nr:ATP-binding protein [Pseudomonadota bacterium]